MDKNISNYRKRIGDYGGHASITLGKCVILSRSSVGVHSTRGGVSQVLIRLYTTQQTVKVIPYCCFEEVDDSSNYTFGIFVSFIFKVSVEYEEYCRNWLAKCWRFCLVCFCSFLPLSLPPSLPSFFSFFLSEDDVLGMVKFSWVLGSEQVRPISITSAFSLSLTH